MGTNIKINYCFLNDVGRFQLPFDNVYFVEAPFDVLQKVMPRFNIISYKKLLSKNLHLSSARVNLFDLKKKNYVNEIEFIYETKKTIKLGYGLELLEFDSSRMNNLVITKLNDFSIPFLRHVQKPYYFKNPESFLCGFIQNYFITFEIKKKNDLFVFSKVNNYLDDRIKHVTSDGEFELDTILEIGCALYKKSIDVDFLKSLNSNVPKVGDKYFF